MYIACDIGGTQFRVAKSIDCINFDDPEIEETPENPEEGIGLIVAKIKNMVGGEKIDGAVFGIAGVLNDEHSELLRSPHLGSWEKIPLKRKLSEALDGAPVFLENDTQIVGLGEATVGAGAGHNTVVYITVSTGIGGARIVNGKFEKNHYGFEPGFQILNNQTLENWEDLASGTAIETKFKIHPKEVAKTSAWEDVEKNVAIGVHNSILFWSPEIVVLGGSMSRDFRLDNIKRLLSGMMKIHPTLPEIEIAKLGSIGGVHGGFAYLRQQFGLN